jgi:CRP-like cAMP-binding protein
MITSQPDLVHGLSTADAERLLSLGRPLALGSDQVLFELGAPADRLFLLERGRIALTLPMQLRGRTEDVVVEEKSPGQTLGWSALVPPHRLTLKARATVDSELLTFERSALLRHFAAHPGVGCAVGLNVASVIGRRLQLFQTMWLREIQRVIELRHP